MICECWGTGLSDGHSRRAMKGLGERPAIPFTALSSARCSALRCNSICYRRASRLPFLLYEGYSCGVRADLTQSHQRFLLQDDRQYCDTFVAIEAVSLEFGSLLF